MPHFGLRILLLLVALSTLAVPALANDTEAQRQAAVKFLEAYVRQDMAAVRKYVPAKVEDYFGAYPFTGAVKLTTPKVDENQALVEFTAPLGDSTYPAKGGVLCRFTGKSWHVRQVLFYDKVPRLLNLPSRSVTNADKKHEPTVKAVAEKFLAAWNAGDAKTMDALWYEWPKTNKDPIDGLSISNITTSITTSAWKDPLVKYSAKVTYKWGILSYSMNFKGGLLLTKQNGDWKVRGSQLLFDF